MKSGSDDVRRFWLTAARFWNCRILFRGPGTRRPASSPPRVAAALTHARLLISQLLLWLSSGAPEVGVGGWGGEGGLFDM